MLNAADFQDLAHDITKEKELKLHAVMRKQFEKFIMDLEMYNASLEDKNLRNLLLKMEKFNDDLRENSQIVELRYQETALEMNNLKEQVEELEAETAHQEAEIIKLIEAREEVEYQMKQVQNQVEEATRETTNFEITKNSREKELEKMYDELRIENREMATENENLRNEANQKFYEINELKGEINTLTKNLENLMEMNTEEEKTVKFEEAVRTSIALRKKAE